MRVNNAHAPTRSNILAYQFAQKRGFPGTGLPNNVKVPAPVFRAQAHYGILPPELIYPKYNSLLRQVSRRGRGLRFKEMPLRSFKRDVRKMKQGSKLL